MNTLINEGSEMGDLFRLVNPKLSIDEYRSKMGEDKDVVVLCLTVFGQSPAEDLVSFIEKSYDYVLDADVSSGETSDGNYVVFIELQRTRHVNTHIMSMFEDIMNLTKQKLSDWTFTYYKHPSHFDLTLENLEKHVYTSPEKYEARTSNDLEESIHLNQLRSLAGVKVQPKHIADVQILDLQYAAGIK